MSDRDPRVDPRVGDVVRKGRHVRTVASLDCPWDRTAFVAPSVGFTLGKGRSIGWVGQGAWEAWADGAEVVQRGEDSR